MSKLTIVREVPATEQEIGLGVIATTPPHIVIAWGEYADQGEADGEIRIIAAVDENGQDATDSVVRIVRAALDVALEEGEI